MAITGRKHRVTALSEGHADIGVGISVLASGIPCDGTYYYRSASGVDLEDNQHWLNPNSVWSNRVNIQGVRVSSVDDDGLINSVGNAYINFKVFTKKVTDDNEAARSITAIEFDKHDGVSTSTSHSEIATMGNFNELVLNEDNDDALHYAVGVFGAGSGISVADIQVTVKGNIVF